MIIDNDYLKELYNNISEEDLDENRVSDFDDFKDYLKDIVICNLKYNFSLKIDNNKLIKMEK